MSISSCSQERENSVLFSGLPCDSQMEIDIMYTRCVLVSMRTLYRPKVIR